MENGNISQHKVVLFWKVYPKKTAEFWNNKYFTILQGSAYGSNPVVNRVDITIEFNQRDLSNGQPNDAYSRLDGLLNSV